MLRPLGGRVLVKQDKLEDTDKVYKQARSSGIYIPELSEKTREQQAVVRGTVIAIGDLAFQPPVGNGTAWVKVGDRVSFAKYSGKIEVDPEDGVEYLLLNDEDLCMEVLGEKND